jgi:tryptophan synthase alpha chain
VARIADAVVVGSALVEQIAQALEANQPPAPKVLASAKALAQAVRESRRHLAQQA